MFELSWVIYLYVNTKLKQVVCLFSFLILKQKKKLIFSSYTNSDVIYIIYKTKLFFSSLYRYTHIQYTQTQSTPY